LTALRLGQAGTRDGRVDLSDVPIAAGRLRRGSNDTTKPARGPRGDFDAQAERLAIGEASNQGLAQKRAQLARSLSR